MSPTRPPKHRPFPRSAPRHEPAAPKRNTVAAGYDAHWKRLRLVFLAANPLCVLCEAEGCLTPATVVDHIKPIAEAPELRLDTDNLRALCKRHHDQHTARTRGWGRARARPAPR